MIEYVGCDLCVDVLDDEVLIVLEIEDECEWQLLDYLGVFEFVKEGVVGNVWFELQFRCLVEVQFVV